MWKARKMQDMQGTHPVPNDRRMNRMKKFSALMLTLALTAGLLAG